jgi:hypothetical protein
MAKFIYHVLHGVADAQALQHLCPNFIRHTWKGICRSTARSLRPRGREEATPGHLQGSEAEATGSCAAES